MNKSDMVITLKENNIDITEELLYVLDKIEKDFHRKIFLWNVGMGEETAYALRMLGFVLDKYDSYGITTYNIHWYL